MAISELHVVPTPEAIADTEGLGHQIAAVSYTHLTLPTNREV